MIAIKIAIQRPLILSRAQDNTLKLWNYESDILELDVGFEESILNAAISPNGLYLAVSFFNHIKYYAILYNQLTCLKTFNIGIFKHGLLILNKIYKFLNFCRAV